MRFSRYGSLLLLLLLFVLAGCAANPYRKLDSRPALDGTAASVLGQPRFQRELYRCVVDGGFLWKKYHLSGILLFKSFDDGSQRAVFQNEMGISFFNFKWDKRDSFSVTSIMPQLDRDAIVKTLRTDFELILRKGLDVSSPKQLISESGDIIAVGKNGGTAWYAVDGSRIVYGGRSPATSISVDSFKGPQVLPSSLNIRHHKARFTIDLKRISEDEQ